MQVKFTKDYGIYKAGQEINVDESHAKLFARKGVIEDVEFTPNDGVEKAAKAKAEKLKAEADAKAKASKPSTPVKKLNDTVKS